MKPARRYWDHVAPDERIDRRQPAHELQKRGPDRRRLAAYPWLFAALTLFVAVMNHVRWTDEKAAMQEAFEAAMVRKDAQIERLRPKPQAVTCTSYPVHMELWRIEHCQRARSI